MGEGTPSSSHRHAHQARSLTANLARVLTCPLGLCYTILITPFVWIAIILSAILNTTVFCLSAPIEGYLEPLKHQARQARTYEEWRSIQAQLDDLHQVRDWSLAAEDGSYDWRGLEKFKDDLQQSRIRNDVAALYGNLRAQANRNCCSMLSSRLFLKSQIQTKRLIHDYIHEVHRCIERLVRRDSLTRPDSTTADEERRRLFSDVRQILGRTTLVLQGGAMLSLCHLGVVKALHDRRLLPKVITATGTGALVAAIVSCTPDNDLLSALEGTSININAFVKAREKRSHAEAGSFPLASWTRAITRRARRFIYTGHFFEIDVLAQCVRDNIGDLTFEEAFVQSGRILNITIAKPDVEGTPQLLNYITAPHVVVWSACAASIATSKRMFAAAPLQCKNDVGVIERYHAVDSPPASGPRPRMSNPRIPMERIGELFDVNHYIVSQTRPYIIPFVRFKDFMCQDPILGAITKVIYCEALHRLDALNRLGFIPTAIQRILIDEDIPSTSAWSKFVIAPELSFLDYFRIFNFPSPQVIDSWALKGERSVWPKICQIKVRCCMELELDAAYRRDHVRLSTRSPSSHSTTINGHG